MAVDRKSGKIIKDPFLPLVTLDDGQACRGKRTDVGQHWRLSAANALRRRPFVRLPLLVTAPTNNNVDDGGSGRQTEELRASVAAADADAVVNAIVDATVTYTQKIQNSASVGTGGGRSPVAGRSAFSFGALPPGRRPKGRPHAFTFVLPGTPPRTDGCDRRRNNDNNNTYLASTWHAGDGVCTLTFCAEPADECGPGVLAAAAAAAAVAAATAAAAICCWTSDDG